VLVPALYRTTMATSPKHPADMSSQPQRAKRQRKTVQPLSEPEDPAHIADLHAAIENSRLENLNYEQPIPEAPVYYPTIEEFADPIKFINSIAPQASQHGICRIVPPEGWRNPTQVDLKSTKLFQTKLQRMSLMQEGRAMGEGQEYGASSYKRMADEFRTNWMNSHYQESMEKGSRHALEIDYWRLIKGASGEDVQVEYGNDLSTEEYGSGFPLRRETDPPLGASTAPFGSDEYYRTCGWNLNNISAWPGSQIRHLTHPIDGINRPWLYLGMLFSSFCWHREDIYLASINYNHVGAAKQWYGIPGSKAQKFTSTMEKLMKLRIKEVPDLEHHITTQINPQVLLSNKIPVCKTTQSAGHFIVTFPQAYHCGFSYGFNCGEAVNFATADWIDHGWQSVHAYRLKFKREVFSFDRLLFTLTYHLDELPVEVCVMLKKHLQRLLEDESHFRTLLFNTGVQDLSSVELPAEGRMSAQIDERLATYDDQRVCSTCQHTCFLSAVCCNCSEQAVSCPKCTDSLCGCPRTNKFLLEWHSIDEIAGTILKVENHIATALAREEAQAQSQAAQVVSLVKSEEGASSASE